MSVFLIDASMDAALDYIKNNVTEMYICTGSPTTRAAAITANLADKTGLTSGSFTGPADGDASGRKTTKNAETAIPIDNNGTAATICYCSATTLLWRADISPTQVLTAGGTVDTTAHRHEIADAA